MGKLRIAAQGLKLWLATTALALLLVPVVFSGTEARTITADVVALEQTIFYNRLGVFNPEGMIYALRRDVVDDNTGLTEAEGGILTPGNVSLRSDKRPRPIVLRMNVGDVLRIRFQNLLPPIRGANDLDSPLFRNASIHVEGMQCVRDIKDDGSYVGNNASGQAVPGAKITYRLYAERQGTYLLYNNAVIGGGEAELGTTALGLFGAVNVLPAGAEYYRSQVTQDDLQLATTGQTADGHPIIDYDAVYPAGHRFAGVPILNMLNGNEIVHSDLNAIITGRNRGEFPRGTFPEVNINAPTAADEVRSRNEPFREFTIIFHDEIVAVQAFPEFGDAVLSHTLHSVADGFAINYGTGGIGAEILANRKGVGPMWDCTECKFEEFFLESWTVGDPAMVVDIPANVPNPVTGQFAGPKATKALYPDDPSNVFHSYIGDHVKMRNLHAGKEHHIFHLHAHQWMFTPNDDNSTYLDSQAIGPGSTYTYEIAYNGSGNRNQTVGDAIFHCHFYPHFAEGMWALWRNHDVFEAGTALRANGRPRRGARALPDGEIAAGTPIPALVPIPGRPMAPMPGRVRIASVPGKPGGQVEITEPDRNADGIPDRNPGYPFFMPAVAGHRNAQPPLDMEFDGGLPRHIIVGGTTQHEETRLSFEKTILTAQAIEIPQDGTPAEKAAMDFHSQRWHDTYMPDGTPAKFRTNGLPPARGAPYAEPCVDDFGNAVGNPRIYRAAAIQLDMIMNKVGWHFPQSRILALWDDVAPTMNGTRPPEPLFFRANTNDCITFYHTNLVPNVYEMDDFQVRTPTDIIGEHIHLVKFDVTSSDGSGNGFNYEDGTFSPQEVEERINAINLGGGLQQPYTGAAARLLTPQAHPFFGTVGAQTTIQRWYADDVRNNSGVDRTLRSVFTHDHFGPSTHQQSGLYATLVVEPEGSTWRNSETGEVFGNRFDGGPTSWRADILPANAEDSYREFLFMFADFAQAYTADANLQPVFENGVQVGRADPAKVINPPAGREVGLPFVIARPIFCPGNVLPPCPEAIMAADEGTYLVNYRNEPLALRTLDDQTDPLNPRQAAGLAGDLSYVFRSDITRVKPELNTQPNFYPPLTAGMRPGDPFTPLMRAYQGDKVQMRLLVGATEEGHNATVHGIGWLQEPSSTTSGYRNSQMMGISEHFEFLMPLIPQENRAGNFTDHLYKFGASVDDLWNGTWGILRAYDQDRNLPNLQPLPNNTVPKTITNLADFNGVCPKSAPVRKYNITAVSAAQALPGGTLVYNDRLGAFGTNPGPLNDPTAILYVHTSDLRADGRLKAGKPVEPLVLRAAAGECIMVTLRNQLPVDPPDLDGYNRWPFLVDNYNANQVRPSSSVGLHPQLVSFDSSRHDGTNVGLNPAGDQTVPPGGVKTYRWYAGELYETSRRLIARPYEFGATNLMPSDPLKHSSKGAIGALIIEPLGATWVEDAESRASATVTQANGRSFREFVLLFQDDINLMDGNGAPIPPAPIEEDAEDSGKEAFNYRCEPLWFRLGFSPRLPGTEFTNDIDYTNSFSNVLTGGQDPATPVFTAAAGTPVRFRVLDAGGHARNHVFNLHGHVWAREPYVNDSKKLGYNALTQWRAAQEGIGTASHHDLMFTAGGSYKVPGDYLFRDHSPFTFHGGLWGILRVQ